MAESPNISSSASAKSGSDLSLQQGPVSFGNVTGPNFGERKSPYTVYILAGLALVAILAVVYVFKKK